jgi:glyoxylase-like metal-dependent hydrolase (beta-lactamase superfamily II)
VADWNLTCLTVGPLQMNAWLLTCDGEAALIDPGDEPEILQRALDANDCRLRYLLATHGHFDHVAAAAAIEARFDLPLRCHRDDLFLIEDLPAHQQVFGFPPSPVPRCLGDLIDEARLPLGSGVLAVSQVPGHTPGHLMFAWPGHALVGDTIFAGSVGRTDLPGGSFDILKKSIRERIYTLPDATILHPGHGPDTTVGREKESNPYVREG